MPDGMTHTPDSGVDFMALVSEACVVVFTQALSARPVLLQDLESELWLEMQNHDLHRATQTEQQHHQTCATYGSFIIFELCHF